MLERAVLNVLDNAAKWSPPHGTVIVRLQRADRWTLDIQDEGPGISAEDLPYVFDRFYRAESARSMPGSGLGLAIVRQVVSRHGGWVSAKTPPGDSGTVVHIELPIVYEQELADEPGPAWSVANGNGVGVGWPPPAGASPDANGAGGQADQSAAPSPSGRAQPSGFDAASLSSRGGWPYPPSSEGWPRPAGNVAED
jgi:hypothetical protein